MIELKAQPGELHMTIQVTRKETGKVEEYQLTSEITEEQAEQLGLTDKEQDHGRNP